MRRIALTPEAASSLPGRQGLRAGFHAQLREAARGSTLLAGAIGLVAFPAWAGFDVVLLPGRAASFLMVRLAFEVAMALTWAALRWRRIGGRWPEQISFILIALPEVAIAWMIPRSAPHLEAYLLGFSLAIYASAFLIVWRWELTLMLIGLTIAVTIVFAALARPGLDGPQTATVFFYVGTAGALAAAGQVYRYRAEWQQWAMRAALDSQYRRNETLVAELDRLSKEDPLTGVGNRRAWEQRLADEIARARRLRSPLSIIVCDFDHFKLVNDQHGHASGDEVLRRGVAILVDRLRAGDYVARLGGDEFAVACPDTCLDAAAGLAGHLADRARAARWPHGIRMTFSLGVAELRPGDLGAVELVDRADTALYRAKLSRDSVCIAAPDPSTTPADEGDSPGVCAPAPFVES